jgi:amphi-Trp domain-containing protein
MSHIKIHEDHRTLSRTELAAELRRVAGQLEAGEDLSYGEAGDSIAVPEQIERELEIEQTKDGAGYKFDIEFKWAAVSAEAQAAASDTGSNL